MKVVILAGGLGTRLAEFTKTIPKPMVKIKNKPIIYFIMKHFSNYGFKDFIIAAGYKSKGVIFEPPKIDIISNYLGYRKAPHYFFQY